METADLPSGPVLNAVADALRDLGVAIATDGRTATIEVAGYRTTRRIRSTTGVLLHRSTDRLEGSVDGDAIYVGEYVRPSAAERLRRAGSWFADTAGNAYVQAPGVLIDVRGRTGKDKRTPSRQTPRNLMSAARAQVVFALLTWEQLVDWGVRRVADVAGVSPALAQETTKLLQAGRYLSPGATRLDRRGELIDLWAASFPLGLGRSLELGRFVGEPDPQPWAALGVGVFVSGEQAVPELQGPDMTLYVPALEPRTLRDARWRRAEPGETPNIVVRRTFWTDPHGRQIGVTTAPPLLVYGDLLASSDPRQREVAAELRHDLG